MFLPRPKVESALVAIDAGAPRRPSTSTPTRCSRWCAPAFGQRRKMLRRSLAGVVTAEQFAAAGVRPEARAEELDVDDWGRLTAAVGR